MISRRCGNFAETEFRFIGFFLFSPRPTAPGRFIYYPTSHANTRARARSHTRLPPTRGHNHPLSRTVKKKEQYTRVYKEKLLTFFTGLFSFRFLFSTITRFDMQILTPPAESSPFDPGRPLSATRRDKPPPPLKGNFCGQSPHTHTHTLGPSNADAHVLVYVFSEARPLRDGPRKGRNGSGAAFAP